MDEDVAAKKISGFMVSTDAYCKIVLHAAKNSVSAVHGLFLGHLHDANVEVIDALPIAHSALASCTSPLTEIALMLARTHAEMRGLAIVGAYFAPEVATDNDIPLLVSRLSDVLRKEYGYSVLITLDAKQLDPEKRRNNHCLKMCIENCATPDGTEGQSSGQALVVSDDALTMCERALSSSKYIQAVSDFEEHCLDIKRDWFNTELLRFIRS